MRYLGLVLLLIAPVAGATKWSCTEGYTGRHREPESWIDYLTGDT